MKSDTTSYNDSTAETIFSNINSRSNNKKKVIKEGGVLAVLLLLTISNLYSSEKNLRRSITLDRRSSSGGSLQTTTAAATNSATTILEFHHESLDVMANQTNQVFVTMPAKAAGTSMKRFNKNCMNHSIVDNVLNMKTQMFADNYDLPSVISSHLFSDATFVDLVKGSTRETLIVYIHREELSRVRSAIQHVLMSKICNNNNRRGKRISKNYAFDVELHQNRCTIDEEHLIRIIKGRVAEIAVGAPNIMTCNYFDAIVQNAPSNLVFVHYKQADKLQQILAKHHCPHILKDLPIAVNVASDKHIEPYVRLQADPSREVTFEEWFDKKQNIILWSLGLKSNMDCQSKVIDMEDHLFSCPDEAVTLRHGVYQCVSMSGR